MFQTYAIAMGFVYYLELLNWFYTVKHVDVSIASSITTPWPVVTAFLAVVFLRESADHYQVAALIITFISVYGILWAGGRN